MPLAVGHLLLFSPLLPPAQQSKPSGDKDEDAHEAAEVAFYSSSDNIGTRDGMLRSLGLAKGLENFVGMMTFPADDGAGPSDEADDGTTVVTSTTSTMLTLSLEGSFKLHVRFTVLSREAASSRTPAVAATAEPMPPASALKAVMKQACERFCLLHGPLSALLPPPSPGADAADNERQRRRLQSSVERYWSDWIEHFAGRAPALLASSHGLALPSSSIAPPAVSAALDPPFALLSHSAITHSPSAQLPTELLHHLLTFVPRPPGEESAPPPVNGAADKAVGKDGPPSSWWDGLGSGLPSMSSMTLGLGRSNGAPAASSSAGPAMPERKSAFPASSLWKKATVDLLSLTSSPSTPPSPTRLPPREEEPKLPADVPLPPSTAASSSASVDELAPTVAGRVDEVTLKEAMEQALPDPEPVTLRWTQLELWLREGDVRAKTAVAFTLLPDQTGKELAHKLFVHLPSSSVEHPSVSALLAAFGPPDQPTAAVSGLPPNGLHPGGAIDHRSFAPSPTKPTLSRSPSAVSLLSTFSTPPRPTAVASPARHVPVSALLRVEGGTALVNGPWKAKGGQGAKRERSIIRSLDLLNGPDVEEVIARTSLSSTWIMTRHAADHELVSVVESKGIGLGDVDRFGRQAERELERQLGPADL